jgi:hypothetical protein
MVLVGLGKRQDPIMTQDVRMSALQIQNPEFKPQYHPPPKKLVINIHTAKDGGEGTMD